MHTYGWNRSLATNSSELRPVLRERALGRVLLFLTFFCVSISGVRPLIRYDRKIFGVIFFLLSSGSPRERTTSVIVTGNFKFCLRKNLSVILRSDINRNAFLTERHLMILFEAFVCFVPCLPSGASNGPVPQNICSSGKFLLAWGFWKMICP